MEREQNLIESLRFTARILCELKNQVFSFILAIKKDHKHHLSPIYPLKKIACLKIVAQGLPE